MGRLQNQIAVITGGTSGIGRATAKIFAEEGAVACILGRSKEKAEQLVSEIVLAGGKAENFLCDVTDAQQIGRTIQDVFTKYGSIDILFNCAGVSPVGTVATTSFEDFKRVMEVDLYSIFLTCHYAIPYMEQKKRGNIINVTGTYGVRPVPNKAGYACAKAGGNSLTKSIAIDYARQGIRCNAISPGFVDTPLNSGFETERRDAFLEKYQPLEAVIQAEDIAKTAVFLASDDSSNITGQNIVVDGGSEACLYYLHQQKGK